MNALTTTQYLTPFRFAGDKVTWMLSSSKYRIGEHGALCASIEREVTVDLPEDFNPVAAEVAALHAQKLLALEAYQRTVAQINDRLANLQALESA
jgi:hypothetical protein